jgi:putative heme-binding domain-containing protein
MAAFLLPPSIRLNGRTVMIKGADAKPSRYSKAIIMSLIRAGFAVHCFTCLALFAIGLLVGPLSAQRREPDPHDVQAGSTRYNSICASCHGQDGDQVAGVDLGHGVFRRATTDQELVNIIRNGIPGTGMPANRMSESAASAVATYLHAMAQDASRNTSKGDAVRGKELYARSGCPECHRIGNNGGRLGPDLTDIGGLRRSVELERSILEPSADIAPPNRLVKIVTRAGSQVEGKLLNQDAFVVLLMDRNEKLRSFDRATLASVSIETKQSIMPSYKGKYTDRELADVVSYLSQLKGVALK